MQLFQKLENNPIRFWEVSGATFALVPAQSARSLIGDRVQFDSWIGSARGRMVASTSPDNALALLRVLHPLPYAWLSPNWLCVSNDTHLAHVLGQPSNTTDTAIVSGSIPLASSTPPPGTTAGAVQVQTIRFHKHALATRLLVQTPTPQLLTVRMPYTEASQLQCTIDQQIAPVVRSTHLWTGVLVPEGTHIVQFSSAHHWMWPGLSLSPLLLCLLFIPGQWRKKPTGP